jgi:hypothetical protein
MNSNDVLVTAWGIDSLCYKPGQSSKRQALSLLNRYNGIGSLVGLTGLSANR